MQIWLQELKKLLNKSKKPSHKLTVGRFLFGLIYFLAFQFFDFAKVELVERLLENAR